LISDERSLFSPTEKRLTAHCLEWNPMAGESGPLGQNEVEQLLKQAQAAGAGAAPSSPGAAPATDASSAASATGAAGISASGDSKSTTTTQSDIDSLLNQAEQALASINAPSQGEFPAGVKPFKLTDFASATAGANAATLDSIRDVELDLRIELGRTHMHLEEVLKLSKGSVVTLDKLAGDPVDIFVNGRLIARGEVLILNENFCVRVAELMAPEAA
jgi:flagellar motor switch protein FliN/FliY